MAICISCEVSYPPILVCTLPITPLKPQETAAQLEKHPDRALVGYLPTRMQFGFCISFKAPAHLWSARKYNFSAAQHLGIHLDSERAEGRVLGPFQAGHVPARVTH